MKALTSYLDMFDLVHRAGHNTDAQWGRAEDLLASFFAKVESPALASFVFYILDFAQKKYLAVGPGVDTFLGYSTHYLKDAGPLGYFEKWHRKDWEMYNAHVFSDHLQVLKETDAVTKRNLLIKANYRVKTKEGRYYALAQQSSYLDVASDGTPLGVIGMVSDITPYKHDNRMIYNITAFDSNMHANEKGKVLLNKFYFPDADDSQLTKREIEILKWICDGLSTKEIASKLFLSPYTVNNHRTNILQKTNSANFAQVLKYAIVNGIV